MLSARSTARQNVPVPHFGDSPVCSVLASQKRFEISGEVDSDKLSVLGHVAQKIYEYYEKV